MHRIDGDRSFADSGGHPLYISGANIAYGKDSGQAGLQHLRHTGQWPFQVMHDRIQVATGENEALAVESHTPLQPLGARRSPAITNK